MYKNGGETENLPENVSKANLQLQLLHFYSPHLGHNWVFILTPTLTKHLS